MDSLRWGLVAFRHSEEGIVGMYASVRHHWFEEEVVDEVLEWVRGDFLHELRGLAEFQAYYGIDAGDGHLVFVSIFDSKASAAQAHEWAMEHVETTWAERTLGMTRESVGEIVIQDTGER